MTDVTPIDNGTHLHLRIDTRPSENYGDNVNRVPVFTTEYGEIHKEFPILFHRDAKTGQYQAHAILGLAADENLFLGEQEWLCNYVPAILARGPFLMGTPKPGDDSPNAVEPVIMIDRDDPRVGVQGGEAVFLATGSNSPYLERVLHNLRVIHHGTILDKKFFACLESLDLLEPVSIKATLSNIEQVELHSYHTINQEKLAQLDGNDLKQLNSLGILGHIYYVLSSLGNVSKLIELKNRRAALA